MEREMMYDYI